MAENDTMEGKDLAKEEKQSFRERLKVQIEKLRNGKTAKEIQNEEQQKDDEKPELEEEDKENQDKKKEEIAKKYNSNEDLDNKAKALDRQNDLEKRGLPSEKKGVQVEEIEGNHKQNVSKNIEDVEKELMTRDGIVDKTTVPTGYYEYKAKKIVALMDDKNLNLTYEQAIEQVEEQEKRPEGGIARGEHPEDPRRG